MKRTNQSSSRLHGRDTLHIQQGFYARLPKPRISWKSLIGAEKTQVVRNNSLTWILFCFKHYFVIHNTFKLNQASCSAIAPANPYSGHRQSAFSQAVVKPSVRPQAGSCPAHTQATDVSHQSGSCPALSQAYDVGHQSGSCPALTQATDDSHQSGSWPALRMANG